MCRFLYLPTLRKYAPMYNSISYTIHDRLCRSYREQNAEVIIVSIPKVRQMPDNSCSNFKSMKTSRKPKMRNLNSKIFRLVYLISDQSNILILFPYTPLHKDEAGFLSSCAMRRVWLSPVLQPSVVGRSLYHVPVATSSTQSHHYFQG